VTNRISNYGNYPTLLNNFTVMEMYEKTNRKGKIMASNLHNTKPNSEPGKIDRAL